MMVNNPNAVDITNSTAYENDQKSEGARDELGKDSFLNLLTTQLKNQNPLEPMNNMNSSLSQFIKSQSVSQGASLIGKTVETVNEDTGKTVKGTVKEVGFEDDKIFAYLENDKKVSMDGISKIY